MLAFGVSSANEGKSIVVYVHDKTEISEQNHSGVVAEDIEVWQEARKLVNIVYEAINAGETFAGDFGTK
jgi:hypothetical protein